MDTSPSHFGRLPGTSTDKRCEPHELAFASIRLGLLLERIGDGDKRAFSSLYELTGGALFEYLAAMLPEPSETEETFSRVYSAIWVSAPRFLATGITPAHWILAIARRELSAKPTG